MQIDIEATARLAPAGAGEARAAHLAAASVLAATAAVLLASCLAVIMGLS